jgi:hypothetical protein
MRRLCCGYSEIHAAKWLASASYWSLDQSRAAKSHPSKLRLVSAGHIPLTILDEFNDGCVLGDTDENPTLLSRVFLPRISLSKRLDFLIESSSLILERNMASLGSSCIIIVSQLSSCSLTRLALKLIKHSIVNLKAMLKMML